MPICSTCGEPKKPFEFGWRNKRLNQRLKKCLSCQRTYGRQHYADNKELYVARNARALEKLRARLRELKNNPCQDCGVKYPPCVMDFDHKDPSTKTWQIAHMVNQIGSWKAILKEVSKCALVCANCHRLRTCARDHDHARKA